MDLMRNKAHESNNMTSVDKSGGRRITPVRGFRFSKCCKSRTKLPANGHHAEWMSWKDCKQRRAVSSSVNRLPSCSIR